MPPEDNPQDEQQEQRPQEAPAPDLGPLPPAQPIPLGDHLNDENPPGHPAYPANRDALLERPLVDSLGERPAADAVDPPAEISSTPPILEVAMHDDGRRKHDSIKIALRINEGTVAYFKIANAPHAKIIVDTLLKGGAALGK